MNVAVSAAINGQGPSAAIVRAIREGTLDLVVCPKWLDELGEVLLEPRFRRFLSATEAVEYVEGLAMLADLRPDPTDPPPRCGNPDDDYVLALTSHGVDLVVGGDDDVLSVDLGSVPVYAPRRAAEAFGLLG